MREANNLLKMILEHKNQIPEMADLLHEILHQFGGPQKFAAEIYTQYTHCDRTPMARTKIIESILRMINTVNELRKPSPIDTMSLEEMQSVFAEAIKEANAKEEIKATV